MKHKHETRILIDILCWHILRGQRCLCRPRNTRTASSYSRGIVLLGVFNSRYLACCRRSDSHRRNQFYQKCSAGEASKFKDYVLSGQDPSVNVVLMEDLAAVLGVTVAATCMGLTSYLDNPMFDAIGSLLVGGLLGAVASFIIYTNVAALIGRSISQENLDNINA